MEENALSKHEVLILAGGSGSRLSRVWSEKPKILAPVRGRPYFDWFVEALYRKGFRRFAFLLGAYAQQVVDYAKAHPLSSGFRFVVEDEPLGTGGAIAHALAGSKSGPIFALNGDSYCSVDFEAMLTEHVEREASVSIGLARVPDGGDYGSVSLDEKGRVLAFDEKKKSPGDSLVNAGVYLLDPSVMELAPEGPFSIEREFFPMLIEKGERVFGFKAHSEILDIGTPERLELAQEKLISMITP